MSKENIIGLMSLGGIILGLAVGLFAFNKQDQYEFNPSCFLPAAAFVGGIMIGIYLRK